MPAVAQSAPAVRWRMSKLAQEPGHHLRVGEDFCKRVAQLTEGRFEIRAFPGGELVPAAQNMDAVGNGTVRMQSRAEHRLHRQRTALTFDTGLSFGLSAASTTPGSTTAAAWRCCARSIKYNIVNHVCGNVGVQMGGWYRKEIKSVADLKGLNMRIGGIGGMVLSSWARCRNRFLRATSTRRAGERHHRRGRMDRALRRRSWASTRWRLTTIRRAGSRAARPSPAWCTTRPGKRCRRPRPRSRPRRANRPCACWPTTTRAIRWRCAS